MKEDHAFRLRNALALGNPPTVSLIRSMNEPLPFLAGRQQQARRGAARAVATNEPTTIIIIISIGRSTISPVGKWTMHARFRADLAGASVSLFPTQTDRDLTCRNERQASNYRGNNGRSAIALYMI